MGLLELSSEEAPVVPSTGLSIAYLRTGEYVVSHIATNTPQFLVYHDDGSFHRLYDRQGEGPGEFSAPPSLYVQEDGDTLVAYDRALGRITRFDASLQLLDTRLSQVLLGRHVLFVQGRMVRGTGIRTDASGRVGSQVAQLDGTPISLFEEREEGEEVVLGYAATPGRFWVIRRGGSEARLYDAEGMLRREVRLERDWFREWVTPNPLEPFQERPRPWNQAIVEMTPGRLLLTTWEADPAWAPVAEPGEPVSLDLSELEDSQFWSTVVEVFDAETGSLLARRHADDALTRVEGTADQYFSTQVDAEYGHVIVNLWRFECTDQSGSTGAHAPGGGGGGAERGIFYPQLKEDRK